MGIQYWYSRGGPKYKNKYKNNRILKNNKLILKNEKRLFSEREVLELVIPRNKRDDVIVT